MKARLFAVAALVAAVPVTIALAQGQRSTDESAAAQAAEPEPERRICRSSKATGSLTRRNRVCRTAAQWAESDRRTQQGVQDFQNGASGSRVTPVCDASGMGPGCAPTGSGQGVVGM